MIKHITANIRRMNEKPISKNLPENQIRKPIEDPAYASQMLETVIQHQSECVQCHSSL